MALDNQQQDLYKRVAATIARRRQPAQQGLSDLIAAGPAVEGIVSPAPQRQTDWSLGQSIIDVLSAGSYATAGVGRKFNENISAIQQGDFGGALDLVNPLSIIPAAASGIADRRTWSDNLTDMGVEKDAAAAIGLGLDIALDPLWLVPGGAIAAGVKGVSKGVATASALNKAGAKLTPEVVNTAMKTQGAIETGADALRIAPEIDKMLPRTGQRIPIYSADGLSNLIQGVKYRTADEYASWSTTRAEQKANKLQRKLDKDGAGVAINDIADKAPAGIMSTLAKPLDEAAPGTPVGETVVKKIEEAIESDEATRLIPDAAKDADINPQSLIDAVEAKSVRQIAREQVEPLKEEYMAMKGIKEPKVNFDAIDTSPMAGKIADEYENAISDPTNPEVVAAYDKLKAEVAEQYDFMVNKLGIKVEFVDEDPYNVMKADGSGSFPSPKEMMRDVIENKRLQVRNSAPDYEQFGAHPLLSVDDNNMFRAVHDFFGHAGSGRGFLADGEEAAWVSHSQMFSPLARRAMTTETRGQNSWFNKYGKGKGPDGGDRFAEQKVFLLPEQYALTPTEFSELERRVGGTNMFAGVATENLQELADRLLPDLGMVWAPIKGAKMYSPEEIKQINAKLDELSQTARFAPDAPESLGVTTLLNKLGEYLSTPSRYASVTAAEGQGSITDILRLAEEAFGSEAKAQGSRARSLAILRQILDQPVDATDLLESALRMENRVISDPKPFKPTVWSAGPAESYSKPPFSEAKFLKYFAEDELAKDASLLPIAFGKVTAKPGTKRAKDLAAQQQVLWEQFRARNHDILAEVAEREKTEWFDANSVANSSLFTKMPDGTVIGQGMLPASIPVGTLYTHNGRVTTTLAAILDKLGTVINRTGPQMGGLPTTRITGGVSTARRQTVGMRGSEVDPTTGERVLVESTVTRGEDIVLQDGARIGALEAAGGLSVPERKKIITAIRKRGREIELDSYPLAVQGWLLGKLDEFTGTVKKLGTKDRRLVDETPDMEGVITRLWNELPFLKSRADARKLATLGPEAVTMLAKAPARRYFIDAEFDRLIGAPDVYGISRAASMSGKRAEQPVVARDPQSGVPIDKNGNPAPEAQADALGGTQYRVLAEGGKAFTGRITGRSGSEIAPQRGTGPQQLAGLQAVRAAIGSITENLGAASTRVTPEQAQLLSSVMNTLQIKVAPNATPSKIFQQFQSEALPRFEEVITRIESAAKIEAVAFQAKSIFRVADDEAMTVFKAIESFDPGELQRQSVKFTDDALALIDETCRIGTRGPDILRGGPAGSSILDEVLGGFGG